MKFNTHTELVPVTRYVPDFSENIARGIALLDQKAKGKWWTRINLRQLDLEQPQSCVVGQLAIKAVLNGPLDGYFEGIKKILPTDDWGHTNKEDEEYYGFNISGDTRAKAFALDFTSNELWEHLTLQWVDALKKIKAARK